jgi:Flp pilus assembly protein TadB
MIAFPRRFAIVTAMLLAIAVVIPSPLLAENHVVSQAEMQKQAIASSHVRQQKIESLSNQLSTSSAQKALKAAQMNPERVKTAVASLSDDELSKLTSRADKAQTDFAAGRISDRDLLLILVAIAALILIIVAVH